ncbi:MAG: 6-carboxytetrahydropterin synthase [Acidobacteria bacterium]|nr:6-carboxytetrahydropterin synthase [Acidobacteriota bacterium]
MPTVRLTRNYHFSASHRLHLPNLSDEENRRLFGKCNNPYGHGHNYILAVTVEGEVSPVTGLVVDSAALDEAVHREVVSVYDHKYLNRDLPSFASTTATTENMAIDVRNRLHAAWPSGFPALAHIRVQETKRNVIELPVIEEVV